MADLKVKKTNTTPKNALPEAPHGAHFLVFLDAKSVPVVREGIPGVSESLFDSLCLPARCTHVSFAALGSEWEFVE